MRAQVINYTDKLSPEFMLGKIAVVIDVFRATSVIVTALASGAKEIIVKREIKDALQEYESRKGINCILGGERKMAKIEGFHFDNSPSSYLNKEIKGKSLILTTTNGTKAIHYCHLASEVYICSILNCIAVMRELKTKQKDIMIVCAGLSGNFALEDAFGAGMLLWHLNLETDDFGIMLMSIYADNKKDIKKLLANSQAYKALEVKGLAQDLDFCLQENIYSIVPKLISDNSIVNIKNIIEEE
jgi:2-phosphosulfolactate phosphatase